MASRLQALSGQVALSRGLHGRVVVPLGRLADGLRSLQEGQVDDGALPLLLLGLFFLLLVLLCRGFRLPAPPLLLFVPLLASTFVSPLLAPSVVLLPAVPAAVTLSLLLTGIASPSRLARQLPAVLDLLLLSPLVFRLPLLLRPLRRLFLLCLVWSPTPSPLNRLIRFLHL